MLKKRFTTTTTLLLASSIIFVGCGVTTPPSGATSTTVPPGQTASSKTPPAPNSSGKSGVNNSAVGNGDVKGVVAKPDDIDVLVNKNFSLPEKYNPNDLVEPNVPFTFKEKDERRLMRKEAAQALEKLFAGAKNDGVYLAGVSGYRSYSTQKSLFQSYVQQDGEEAAKKYSAEPGHSEHETGLAIDLSGSTGKCAAEDCFAGTPEAKWLDQHASEYGFIIRYPNGKESITGYQYEPWHIRYVGTKISQEIAEKNITLEEYFQNVVPVLK